MRIFLSMNSRDLVCRRIRLIFVDISYGIYTYIWMIFMVNVGKYNIPCMDSMGYDSTTDTATVTIFLFKHGDFVFVNATSEGFGSSGTYIPVFWGGQKTRGNL